MERNQSQWKEWERWNRTWLGLSVVALAGMVMGAMIEWRPMIAASGFTMACCIFALEIVGRLWRRRIQSSDDLNH